MAKTKKGSVVLTARDLLNGYTAGGLDYNIYNMTPLQMVSAEEKDESWKKWNLDWLERAGIRQLMRDSKRLIKNYHLANGIIDKMDYIIGDHNEYSDQIATIAMENQNGIPIRFYPIIPNVINVMQAEHAKRDSRIIAKQTDEQYLNEMNEYKMQLVTQILVQRAEQQKMQQLQEMGIDMQSNDPKVQQMVQQQMQAAQQLAQAEVQFKNYRGIGEQWANHMIEYDNDRFRMYLLDNLGFRDSLVTDREFWHIRVLEDDYKVELWNPISTFYHKSPETYYIADGNYVGRILLMSIPDVIDLFGDKMTEEQITELKNGYRIINHLPLVDDAYRDQYNFYTNHGQSYPKNIQNVTWGQSIDGKFVQSMGKPGNAQDNNVFNMTWHDLNRISTDYFSTLEGPGMVRVTEAYWRSQMKVGKLTRITKAGDIIKTIVDENYIVTEKPIYDKSIHQIESDKNLVYGEHIDWTWINQTRYGVKINSSLSTYYTRNYTNFDPIYIGGDPIPFEFKGQGNLYGSKLPVEGKIFSERNSFSSSMVDQMKSYQIQFNVFNNQILEMTADEIGNVFMIDQNMIPRNSLGGEWGKYNYPMFHQVMKEYNIAAVDTSVVNSGVGTNFQHFQTVDLTKTQQILSRIQLADWAKMQCYEVVGITKERLGSIAASSSATGVQQAVNNSYAQTEKYFEQHMNDLMPRVRQMMLDAAQFITATKPKSRITYLNSDDQNIFFEIEGYKLLMADFRILARSTADVKGIVDQLRKLALENNTAGGSLYEIAQVLTLQSPAEIMSKLKEADERRQQNEQAQSDQAMQLQQQQQQYDATQKDKEDTRQDYWEGKKLETEIMVAQIRASQSKSNDVNGDGIPDPLEALDMLEQQKVNASNILNDQRKLDMTEKQHDDTINVAREKLQVEREKMNSDQKIEAMKVKVAAKKPKSGSK